MAKQDTMGTMKRREFLKLTGGAAVLALGTAGTPAQARQDKAGNAWQAGEVAHIIPTANHERFLLKTSLKAPHEGPVTLLVDGRTIPGSPSDPTGRFWTFDVRGLNPATQYQLQLVREGEGLCDPWPLKTFPAPESNSERLRVLAYTCAGGYDSPPLRGRSAFLDMTARRTLLARGMSFQPDVVIANGDHIYWDIKTTLNKPFADYARDEIWPRFGKPIDIALPVTHRENLGTFLAVCDYQIAGLYGTTLRSTPSFFVTDDHDMFENDEWDRQLATLPTDDYGLYAAEQTQRLYYPEFLPDRNRPLWLRGGNLADRVPDVNMTFGTLRYGNLLESVFYDCRRFVDLKGEHARVLPQWTEDWLIERTLAEDTRHFWHAPSLPFGYSSGKLGDWYPDLLDAASGRLVMSKEKRGWQPGWFGQHQRLIEALASQKKRKPLILQGDFHALAAGSIHRSGSLDLRANPVQVVMTGPLGTGDMGYPSSYRAAESTPSALIGMDAFLDPLEKNGFTIIDITPDKITFSLYAWRPPQGIEEIGSMGPVLVREVARDA